MFIAVGDEGRQWVDMVGMLHHWDFIGLLMEKKKKREREKIRHKEFMSRRRRMCNKCHTHNIQNRVNASLLVAKIDRLLSHTVYMHMISVGHCSKGTHGVNRPSCVHALYGKHHSLCV